MFSRSTMFLKKNMKKPASKVAELAQIQPKSQFLFHKNLPLRDCLDLDLDDLRNSAIITR